MKLEKHFFFSNSLIFLRELCHLIKLLAPSSVSKTATENRAWSQIIPGRPVIGLWRGCPNPPCPLAEKFKRPKRPKLPGALAFRSFRRKDRNYSAWRLTKKKTTFFLSTPWNFIEIFQIRRNVTIEVDKNLRKKAVGALIFFAKFL